MSWCWVLPDRVFKFGRRHFLLAGLVFFLTAFAPPLRAITEADASRLVDALIADLNQATALGRNDSQMFQDVERLLAQYSDIPVLARSALGVAWRTASDDQKVAFSKAFGGYLARKYSLKFRDFAVARVSITGTRPISSGYLVSSVVHLNSGAFYGIDWQVMNIGGQDKLVNLVIEGISMLASERSLVGSMLDRRNGDIDKLIADLRSA